MKYIGKISSVLLTVAFVVAIVFAADKKNEIKGSKISTAQQFQEKNQASFIKKKHESVVVYYDKEEGVVDQETNKPTETEKSPQIGNEKTAPINNVIHSAKLNSVKKPSRVYTKSTLMGDPQKSLTKQELLKLVQQFNADPKSITASEYELIVGHEDIDGNQNDASADRGAQYSAPSVVINELMYNPAMPDTNNVAVTNDDREFVELYNTTSSAIDLTGWSMSDGINYTFPAASIAAGGYLVLAKDSVAYYAKHGSYPDLDWGGDTNGSLANSGEDVEISDASGVGVDSVDFNDNWYSSTDGDGPSLERVHPNLNGDLSTSWAAYTGTDSAGTPGALNSSYQDLLVDGFEDGSSSGWTIINNDANTNTFAPYNYSYYAHSGSYTMRVGYNSVGNDDWLITPKLSVTTGDSIVFWARSGSSSWLEDFNVKLSTTADTIEAFTVTLGSITSAPSSYVRHAYALEDYAGDSVYIAVQSVSVDALSLYLDDFTGPAIVYPSTPTATLSASSLSLGKVLVGSTNTATVTLSNGGTADLVYTVTSDNTAFAVGAASGTVPWLTSDELTITFSPTTATADSANLVFTHNGSSSPDTVSITGSGTYSILAEGFESGAWTGSPGAPSSWSQIAITAATTGPWARYGPYAAGGGVYAGNYSARASNTSAGHEHILATPALDLTSNTNAPLGYQLEFMIKGYSGSSTYHTDVYVEIDSASAAGGVADFTGSDTLFTFSGYDPVGFPAAWAAHEARLGSYSGTYHIGFRVVDYWGYYAYLDDIEVLPIPPQPTVELDANSFKMIPQLIGDSVTTQLTIGSNSGGGSLVVSSITSSNPEFVVAPTTTSWSSGLVEGSTCNQAGWGGNYVGINLDYYNANQSQFLSGTQIVFGSYTYFIDAMNIPTNCNSGVALVYIVTDQSMCDGSPWTWQNDYSFPYIAAGTTWSVATGDTILPAGDIDLDVTWEPTTYGMKKSTVIVTHNAASSPDTLTFMGEAGRQYIDFINEDFPYGWRNLDLDPPGTYETEYYGYAEGEGWSHYISYPPGYGDYGDPYARSHFSIDGANDWMITEKVVPVAGDSMIFYSNSSTSTPADTLFVYLSTSNEVDSLLAGTHLDTVLSQGYTDIRSAYSLATWVGDTVFLAIQHKGSVGTNYYSYRKVDDILLPQRWVDPNPVLASLPGEVSFPSVFPGDSSTSTGSLYNAGGSSLVISSVASDNAAFTVTPTSATVLSDSTATFTGTFLPTASGADTAHVVFTSNSASSPDTVMFTGSGFPTSGGPDLAGNTWVSSRNANGTAFAWIDTSGAEDTGAMTSDDSYGVIDLPFPVHFNGLPYSEITASSNGLIGLGQIISAADYSNDPIPSTNTPNNYIAPMWDDWTLSTWSTGIPGAILTKTVGYSPNRKFAVTFQDMVKYGSDTDYYTWQVVFDEATGNIVVQYLDLSGSSSVANYGVGATVGIENADGTDGLEVSYNGSYTLEDSSTITFVAGPAAATGVEGVVVSTDGSQVGGVKVWANGSLLAETGQNTTLDNPGFEDTGFIGAWNNNATEPWWVYPPELLDAPNFYQSSAGDLIWNDSLGAFGTNVFTPAAGTRALKVWGQYTAGVENYTTIYKEIVSFQDVEDAYVSAWVMTAEDNKIVGGNGFFVSLIWLNSTYDIVHQDQSEWITADSETDEWHYIDAHGSPPATAVHLQMTLSYYQDAANSLGSVYVDEAKGSLNPGHYAYYGAPAGDYSVEFAKEGFNSSFYTTTIALNDTVELNAMITPEALVDYHSGFEASEGDDLGDSNADDPDGALFEVLDSLHLVFIDSVGVDTTGGGNVTIWDTTEVEIDPYMGDGMLVYPGSGRDAYENDAVAMWVAGETFDASNYMEGGGYVNMSWRANFETEEDFDYFYVGLMLEDSSVIWDEDNGALTGESTGWDYFASDVSWVSALVGAETVTPVVMFSSDASVVEGWGGAFDEIDVSGNPYFLAGPGRLEAESFGTSVPLHWEGPASSGRATYNLRRFNLGDMDNLRRPSTQVNGTTFVLSKGQREFESLQIEVDFDNSSLPRDVLSYTLHRREWTGGMIGEWEEFADDLITNQYYDFDVEEGGYYDYRVSLMYDEGPADWESNEAQAYIGIPNVVLMDSMQMEDFYPDLGGWTVHTTDSTVTWVTGDSADYDSLNSTAYYAPPDFDSSFAFVVGAGQNTSEPYGTGQILGTVVLMSPFMDWSWHTSGLVGVDVWHYTPSSWYDYYGSAKLMVRSQMQEWHEVVDVSYSHTDPVTYNQVFDPELVDVGPMVGGRDRVQFAFVWDYPEYYTGNYSGLAIDNFELQLVDGPDNLSYTATTESVSLFWEAFDGRRASEFPYMMSQEEKEAQIQLLQNGMSKNIAGAQTLGRSLDGAGDIRNNNRDLGDNMSEPYEFTLNGDTLLTGTTVGFTNDYDETCPYSGSTSPDVVYKMTIPDSLNGLIIDLCDSWYDSKVYVYSGADLANGDTTNIACNDDFCSSDSSSYTSYLEIGSSLAEDGGVSAGYYYIVIDGYGTSEGTYWMEVTAMVPPADMMYNVWKDGNLTADELADTVLTYTDYNVSLLESEYTVNASRLMSLSIPGASGLDVGYAQSEHSNSVFASKVNMEPGAFNLVTPADNASLVITEDNVGGNQIFAWSQSVDPNGSEITYHIFWQTEVDTGTFVIGDDTTGTAVLVPIQLMADIMTGLASATGEYIADFEWTVWANDGYDQVEASNGPRTITVDVGWYLGIDDVAVIPGVFALHQNYPNPFNPVTTIRYDVPEQSHVTMEIYNLLGQRVATLVNGIQEPGYHAILWNGTNMDGAAMSSGMYFYHIKAGDFRAVKKLILVK